MECRYNQSVKWLALLLAITYLVACGSQQDAPLDKSIEPDASIPQATEVYAESVVAGHAVQNIYAIFVNDNGEIVISGTDENSSPISQKYDEQTDAWQATGVPPDRSLLPPESTILRAFVTQQNSWWVEELGQDSGGLYLVQAGEVKEIEVPHPDSFISNLQYDPAGNVLVQLVDPINESCVTFVYDAETGELKSSPQDNLSWMVYADRNQLLSYIAESGKIHVHDADTGEELHSFIFEPVLDFIPLATTPDNSVIAVTSAAINIVDGNGANEIEVLGAKAYAGPGYVSAVATKGNEYWIIYDAAASTVIRYTPTDNAAPPELLKVWSIEEQELVRSTAIKMGGVDYTVATLQGSALTHSDVIRTLNTELLAGTGPDVIVLDGLPLYSYIKNGLLEDLSGLLDESLYHTNILNTYKEDGGTFAYPALFRPNLMVRKDNRGTALSELDTLADIERAITGPDNNLNFAGYDDVFDTFYQAFAHAMFPNGKSVNEQEVENFLASTNAIVTAAGLTGQKTDEQLDTWMLGLDLTIPKSMEAYSYDAGTNYAFGSAGSYSETIGALGIWGNNDTQVPPYEVAPMPGNTFVPLCVVGVNANSQNKDAARAFVQSLFEAQIGALQGFFVRRGAELAYLTEQHDKEAISEITFVAPQDFGLEDVISQLETPTEINHILREKVYTEAAALYDGKITPQECVNRIVQNTRLYFEEMQ